MFKSFLRGCGRCLKLSLQTYAPKNLPRVNGGPSGGYGVRRPRSKDPHRREWMFVYKFLLRLIRLFSGCTLIYYTTFPDMDKDKIFPHAVIWI